MLGTVATAREHASREGRLPPAPREHGPGAGSVVLFLSVGHLPLGDELDMEMCALYVFTPRTIHRRKYLEK